MNKRGETAYHEDVELFRSALSFSEAETGFNSRLIEKDYYCSLLLKDLQLAEGPEFAFKGGTSLSKIHAKFYRLSEDLDFGISTPVDAPRRDRSKRVASLKSHLASITSRMPCFQIVDPLRGYNNSTQYCGQVRYASLVSGQSEHVKIEISVREPIVEAMERLPARTLLMDPFRRLPAVEPIQVNVLSRREAYAEKLRAALSRRDPAIRDFFDLDHACRANRIKLTDRHLIDLVRTKLSIPGNEPIDISLSKLENLRQQVDIQLKPVLRDSDIANFELDRAYDSVRRFSQLLSQ
jgi:predicted nucleotidyltransferase component of viral defense system